MSDVYLRSPRLWLRRFTEGDAPLLKDLDSDPEVMRFLTDGVPTSDRDVEAAIKRVVTYYGRFEGRFGLWAAYTAAEQTYIGWFLLSPDRYDNDNDENLELGYRLKRAFWGNGYATEMSRLLVDKAFGEAATKTVWAKTMKLNTRSAAVMQKVGMTFDRDFEETDFPGADKRAVRYVLTRAAWSELGTAQKSSGG